MTETQKRMIEKLRLSEDDFQLDKKSSKDRIKELESQNEMLTECIIEMANIIYAQQKGANYDGNVIRTKNYEWQIEVF